MMRVCVLVVVAVAGLAAQPPPSPPATQPRPGAPVAASSVPPPRPADRPVRLLAAQQLAMGAYPEVRTRGLQIRVEEAGGGTTVTIGFAEQDRDTILALSRPRAAQLVVEATFDAADALTRAVLRGPLAHTKERREAQARPGDWAQALEDDGAAFPPAKQAAFVQQLDLGVARTVAGWLAVRRTRFQRGVPEDGMYWEVAATSAAGDVTLGFEPYAGRLVKVVRLPRPSVTALRLPSARGSNVVVNPRTVWLVRNPVAAA